MDILWSLEPGTFYYLFKTFYSFSIYLLLTFSYVNSFFSVRIQTKINDIYKYIYWLDVQFCLFIYKEFTLHETDSLYFAVFCIVFYPFFQERFFFYKRKKKLFKIKNCNRRLVIFYFETCKNIFFCSIYNIWEIMY